MSKKVIYHTNFSLILTFIYFLGLTLYSFNFNDTIYDRPTYLSALETERYYWWPILSRLWFQIPQHYNVGFHGILALHHFIFYCGFLLSLFTLIKANHAEKIWPFVFCFILLADSFFLVHLRAGLSFISIVCATVFYIVGRTWVSVMFSIFSVLFHAGSFGFLLLMLLVNLCIHFKIKYLSRRTTSLFLIFSLFSTFVLYDLMSLLAYVLPSDAKIGLWTLRIAQQQSQIVPLATIIILLTLALCIMMLLRSPRLSVFFVLLLIATTILFLIGGFTGSFMLRGIKHNYLFPLLFILSSTMRINFISLRLYWKKTI